MLAKCVTRQSTCLIPPVVAQVAERTAADKKGGHLCKRKSDGRLLLRESAMVQDEDKKAFEDISKCAAGLAT